MSVFVLVYIVFAVAWVVFVGWLINRVARGKR